ncbi:hypothetical protein [Mycolicibacterium celeriflavum]|uniref:hypothetical protein n=1 Tax=Mycolicibacterium celeriflavum TaxID=1249101 RepID=UPI003CEE6FC6
MAVVRDTGGTEWQISRRWWPFPGDALDLAFGWLEILVGAVFLVLWPFWLLAKFCGVRWVITIERDGHQVGRELVRGWKRSKGRMNEIALQIAAGGRGGRFVI